MLLHFLVVKPPFIGLFQYNLSSCVILSISVDPEVLVEGMHLAQLHHQEEQQRTTAGYWT